MGVSLSVSVRQLTGAADYSLFYRGTQGPLYRGLHHNFNGIAGWIVLALIEKEGFVVGEVPKVNNALDEMDSNGIVVSSEHNQALHFLLQPKLCIPNTMNTCLKRIK